MKKIGVLFVIVLLFTACNHENNVKSNNSSIASAPPSQTQLTIRKLLDYVDENKDNILNTNSSVYKYDNSFKIAFQNIYGDEQPELIFCIKEYYYTKQGTQESEIVYIYTVQNNTVIKIGKYSNFLINDQYLKFSLKEDKGEIYIFSTRVERYDYNELYNQDYYDYDKNALVKNDYLELTFYGVHKISKLQSEGIAGDNYGFQTIKATSQQLFFYNACNALFYDKFAHLQHPWMGEGKNLPKYDEKPLSEYFVEECKPYKSADTGLYELYTVEKDVVDTLWGEKDYFLSFETRGSGPDVVVLPKADYEKLYAEFMSDFEDYSSTVYMSDTMTIEKFDLDKIEKEAMMVFETKAS